MQAQRTGGDLGGRWQVYARYEADLAAMSDHQLAQEEERMLRGFLTCEGQHDRQTNPRYGLYVEGWELTQREWDKRNGATALRAAIAS